MVFDGLDGRSVTRAVESGPTLHVARSDGVAADTAVRLLRAASASMPL
jgi:hypothetical protein